MLEIVYTHVCKSELIAVRVYNRQQNPVIVIEKVRFSDIFSQLSNSPSDGGRRDPFPGVDPTIDEDDWFASLLEVCG